MLELHLENSHLSRDLVTLKGLDPDGTAVGFTSVVLPDGSTTNTYDLERPGDDAIQFTTSGVAEYTLAVGCEKNRGVARGPASR